MQSANAINIESAATLLKNGHLVSFPTETVYGLGADATNDKAVAEIFAIKGRPEFNPLIVHVDSLAMAKQEVEWSPTADILAKAFWPGPLTLVLPRKANSSISLLASAGGDTLGVRMPAHDIALTLITAAAKPLAAPSSNRSGRVSPTTAQHVKDEFGDALPVLDGGACIVGVESTVLDLTSDAPLLLRHGGVPKEALEAILGVSIATLQEKAATLKSPGMLESHYAPSLPVRLNVTKPFATEALLSFGSNVPKGAKKVVSLSDSGDDKEAAAKLFAALRALDSQEFTAIAVMPIPETGLGSAINDRLRRAAADRQS